MVSAEAPDLGEVTVSRFDVFEWGEVCVATIRTVFSVRRFSRTEYATLEIH